MCRQAAHSLRTDSADAPRPRWAWPRSEANLYGEIKRLVPPGLAHAVEEDNGRRTRTRYQITDDGRAGVGFTPAPDA
jgi:DNA-binding PadR family transcriptional regulator